MTSLQPTKGVLLVAKPSIICDVSFNRSIILLAEYSENGSVGFILNKPLGFTLSDFIPDIHSEIPIYNGGPVEQDNLYFIHKIPDLIPESLEISQGIFWGGNFNIVLELLKHDKIKETDIRFFLGYSGWEQHQLDEELKLNTWVVIKNIYKKNVLEKINPDFWKEKMIEFGGDYAIWSNAPEDPTNN